MRRRLLSLLLSIIMIAAILPIPAASADDITIDEIVDPNFTKEVSIASLFVKNFLKPGWKPVKNDSVNHPLILTDTAGGQPFSEFQFNGNNIQLTTGMNAFYTEYNNTYTIEFSVKKGEDYVRIRFVITYAKPANVTHDPAQVNVDSYEIVTSGEPEPDVLIPREDLVTLVGTTALAGFEYADGETYYVLGGLGAIEDANITYTIAGVTGKTATVSGNKLAIPLHDDATVKNAFSQIGTPVSISITKVAKTGYADLDLSEAPVSTKSATTKFGNATVSGTLSVTDSAVSVSNMSPSSIPDHHSMSIQLYNGTTAVGSPGYVTGSGTTNLSVPSGLAAGTILTAKVRPQLPGMNPAAEVTLGGSYTVPFSSDQLAVLSNATAMIAYDGDTGDTYYTLSGLESLNGMTVHFDILKDDSGDITSASRTISGGGFSVMLNSPDRVEYYSELGREAFLTITALQTGSYTEDCDITTARVPIDFMDKTALSDFTSLSLIHNGTNFVVSGLDDLLPGDDYLSGHSISILFTVGDDTDPTFIGEVATDGIVMGIMPFSPSRSSVEYLPGQEFDPGDEISGTLLLNIPGMDPIYAPLGGSFTVPFSEAQLAALQATEQDANTDIEYGETGVYYVLSGLESLSGNWISFNILESDDPDATSAPDSVQIEGGKARIPLTSNDRKAYYSELGRDAYITIIGLSTGAGGSGYSASPFTSFNTAEKQISFDISTDIEDFEGLSIVFDYAVGKFKLAGLLGEGGIIGEIPDFHEISVSLFLGEGENKVAYATGTVDADGYITLDEAASRGFGTFSTTGIKPGDVISAELLLEISTLNPIPVTLNVGGEYIAVYGIIDEDIEEIDDTLAIENGLLVSKGLQAILFTDAILENHIVTADIYEGDLDTGTVIAPGVEVTFDPVGDGVFDFDKGDYGDLVLGDELTVIYYLSNGLIEDYPVNSTSSATVTFGDIDAIGGFESLVVDINYDEDTVIIPGLEAAIGNTTEATAANGYSLTADIYKEDELAALATNVPVGLDGEVDISALDITVGDRIELALTVNTNLIDGQETAINLKMADGDQHVFAGMTREQVIALYIGANSSGQIAILGWPGDTTIGLARIDAQIWMNANLTDAIEDTVVVGTSNGVLVADTSDELEIGDNIDIALEFKNPLMSAPDSSTWPAVSFPVKLHGVLETVSQVEGLGLAIGTDGQLHVTGLGADWQALHDSQSDFGSAFLTAVGVERTNRTPNTLGSNLPLYDGDVTTATNNLYDLTADKAKIGDIYGADLNAKRGAYLDQDITLPDTAAVTLGDYITEATAEVEADLINSKIYVVNGGFGTYADWQALIADYPDATVTFEVYKAGVADPAYTKIIDADSAESEFALVNGGNLIIGDMLTDLGAKYGDEFTFFISVDNGVWLEDGWELGSIKIDMYNLMKMHHIPEKAYVMIYEYDGGILNHDFLHPVRTIEGKFNFFQFAEGQTPQVKVNNTNRFRYGINTIKYRDWHGYDDIESVTGVNLTRSWFTFKFTEGQYAYTTENDVRSDNIHKIAVKTNFMQIGITTPTYYHTIRAFAGNGGSITPGGVVSVPNGGNQSFIITPNEGYAVQAVIIDGVNRGALTSFTFTDVDSDHSIVASFVKTGAVVTPGTGGLPSINIPTIPATGSLTMAVPAALLMLMGLAIIPRRRK